MTDTRNAHLASTITQFLGLPIADAKVDAKCRRIAFDVLLEAFDIVVGANQSRCVTDQVAALKSLSSESLSLPQLAFLALYYFYFDVELFASHFKLVKAREQSKGMVSCLETLYHFYNEENENNPLIQTYCDDAIQAGYSYPAVLLAKTYHLQNNPDYKVASKYYKIAAEFYSVEGHYRMARLLIDGKYQGVSHHDAILLVEGMFHLQAAAKTQNTNEVSHHLASAFHYFIHSDPQSLSPRDNFDIGCFLLIKGQELLWNHVCQVVPPGFEDEQFHQHIYKYLMMAGKANYPNAQEVLTRFSLPLHHDFSAEEIQFLCVQAKLNWPEYHVEASLMLKNMIVQRRQVISLPKQAIAESKDVKSFSVPKMKFFALPELKLDADPYRDCMDVIGIHLNKIFIDKDEKISRLFQKLYMAYQIPRSLDDENRKRNLISMRGIINQLLAQIDIKQLAQIKQQEVIKALQAMKAEVEKTLETFSVRKLIIFGVVSSS